jgi:hypothetical protein
MTKAYTPGLKVAAATNYRVRRLLPVPGDVRVEIGARVNADSVIAETFLDGDVFPVKAASVMGVQPAELPALMVKQIGDAVNVGDVIAQSKGIFGMMRTQAKATAAGVIENISGSTGMVLLRGPKTPIQVRAFVDGIVTEVLPREGAVVETPAAFIQGIFGVGGERWGPLFAASSDPASDLSAKQITAAQKGAVLFASGRMTAEAIAAARANEVAALVCGGIDDADLRNVLGHDLGVAVTGNEQIGITLIVTEGFGSIRMARKTFDLLGSLVGRQASVNGATQIRAGVIRPEITVPLADAAGQSTASRGATTGLLQLGTPVRVIRDPYFGLVGTVSRLPDKPATLASGSLARVLEVQLEHGACVTVPRANVELIEG